MAGPCVCKSFSHNSSPLGKNKFVESALKVPSTNGSKTLTHIFAIFSAPASALTPVLLLVTILVVANLTVRYSEADFQQIIRTIVKAKALALIL